MSEKTKCGVITGTPNLECSQPEKKKFRRKKFKRIKERRKVFYPDATKGLMR